MDAPAWLDELSLRPGPPWHAMGTRALSVEDWRRRTDGADVAPQLARKDELLRTARATVSARVPVPTTAPAEAEAAGTVVGGAGLGDGVDSPLEAAARRVPDDLCVLVRRDGHWRLDAGVVCFPSMWSVADKIGRPLAEVHEPVPAYDTELAARVDRFLDRLTADRPVWRRNWLIHATDELHLPHAPAGATQVPEVPDGMWLRSELQTLRLLPWTGAVLFTIRTQQVPLWSVATRADVRAGLADSIRSWSDELVAYRGAAAWRPPVLAWLDEAAGA